jgi:hypothetical protein
VKGEFSVQVLKALWGQKGAKLNGQEGEGWEEEKGERAQVGINQGLQVIGSAAACMKTSSR